jgi:hypothetical protein
MKDYTIFYRDELSSNGEWGGVFHWDIFISAYNSSDRVNAVFKFVNATNKHWIIQPDYGYEIDEYPQEGKIFESNMHDEAKFIDSYINDSGLTNLHQLRICVDITGFIKPYMMYLIFLLKRAGVVKLDVIYSEPDHYSKKEKTIFSDEDVYDIRQVHGFGGAHKPNIDMSKEILIIGSGYDDELISKIADNKNHCRKLQIFGLPSLRPEMYQENILNAHKASEAIGAGIRTTSNTYFAPANDPFVVATELSSIFQKERDNNGVINTYLCPLATKPQALGFTLFYLTECENEPVSMIYPFCHSHAKETSIGISRISKYTLEFIN